MKDHLLTIFVFLPIIASGLVLSIPPIHKFFIRVFSLLVLGLQSILGFYIFQQYDISATGGNLLSGFRFVEKADWITLPLGNLGTLSIDYVVGVDGFSIPMVLLSSIVMFIGGLSSLKISEKISGYWALFLLLSGTVAGCFVALDFFLFFIFFEFMLLPMFFLIAIWGGPKREYAAIKYFLFTLAGSVFILLTMMGLYLSVIDPVETAEAFGLLQPGQILTADVIFELQQLLSTKSLPVENLVHTFNMVYMGDAANLIPDSIFSLSTESRIWGFEPRAVAFVLLMIGFAVKLPVVPLHTWLPDAHVEAATPISIVLAGILLKIGAYGFLRIAFPIFPEMAVNLALPLALIGVFSILYAALCAFAQYDLKKLIAYSSVSHMGFVLLGIATLTVEGISGAIFQMFSHGLIATMLFFIAGVLYERTGDRMRDHYSGLFSMMPHFSVFAMIAFFASMGLPGLAGFIGEILVLLGAFESAGFNQLLPRWVAVGASFGILLAAAYYLYAIRKMFFGKSWYIDQSKIALITDLTFFEKSVLVLLSAFILGFGLYPAPILSTIEKTVTLFVDNVFYF